MSKTQQKTFLMANVLKGHSLYGKTWYGHICPLCLSEG